MDFFEYQTDQVHFKYEIGKFSKIHHVFVFIQTFKFILFSD